jgi:hypothetical protein
VAMDVYCPIFNPCARFRSLLSVLAKLASALDTDSGVHVLGSDCQKLNDGVSSGDIPGKLRRSCK